MDDDDVDSRLWKRFKKIIEIESLRLDHLEHEHTHTHTQSIS